MRERLRRHLIDSIDSVREETGGVTDYTKSHVREVHAVTRDEGRPFLVIVEGPLDPGEDWAGIATALEIWPHVEYTSFTELDPLVDEILELLDESILEDGSKRFYLEKLATGGDQHVPEWETITRSLRFSVFDLAFLSGETFDPDPVSALAEWTRTQFGAELQTDPDTWRPSAAQPGVYWRLQSIPRILEQFPVHTWFEARVMGHVIAPDYPTRLEWTRRVHQGISTKRRFRMGDGSPLYIEGAGADSAAHPIRTGQITAICRFAVLADVEPKATVEHVFVGGDVTEQEVENGG